MAIEVLRRGSRDSAATDEPRRELAIGEPDARVFVCPSCTRPLATGTRRCPGCGLRLLLDVPAAKASALLVLGLAVGLAAGGGSVAGAWALQRMAAAEAAGAGTAVAGPPAAPATALPVTGPVPPSAGPLVPAAPAAALRGTVKINGRMTLVAAPLAETLATRPLDAPEIARQLRRLSTDVRAAEALVPTLDRWPVAADHATVLAGFYVDLGDAIRDGLSVSIRSESAYRRSGERVLEVLARVVELDGAARVLAAEAGLTLPDADLAPVPPISRRSAG